MSDEPLSEIGAINASDLLNLMEVVKAADELMKVRAYHYEYQEAAWDQLQGALKVIHS